MHWIGLVALGVVVGALGTLVGAGGGFVLMPILVLLYPDEKPEALACISLAVVFLNALSGSIGYARLKLIDYSSGKLFLLSGIPGAVAGAFVTSLLPREAFDLWLGGTLVLAALGILVASPPRQEGGGDENGAAETAGASHGIAPAAVAQRRVRGVILSFGVGFISSLLGIGGGIIHVPAMVYLLRFPVHVAAATSHFVLTGTSLAGTLVHIFDGSFTSGYGKTAALGVGVIVGAQIGARFSKRAAPAWILRGLAIALAGVGVRVIMVAISKTHG